MTALAGERISSTGPRIAFLHGFTQTRESWRPLAERFTKDHEVLLLDAPNHGESAGVDAGFTEAARLLADAVDGGTCVGYSMGGRLALQAALDHPHRIGALVLVSSTAGIDDETERAARRDADERLAAEIERVGTAEFLRSWLSQPMFAHLHPTDADLTARRGNPPHALARSLRRCGTGAQQSLWPRLADLSVPVLLVCGEDDRKFTDIACRMAASLPQAVLEIIEGAGHAPHLEQPDAFAALLRDWLTDNDR